MDCPQCGAGVPSDDAFCGKCGYAMRDRGPERLDQSRIRVHEEPEPTPKEAPGRPSSHQRIRKHTVLGMPSLTPSGGASSEEQGASPAQPAPTPPPRPPRPRGSGRTPQKTMLGLPQLEVPTPSDDSSTSEPVEPVSDEPVPQEPVSQEPADRAPSEPPAISSGPPPSHRARARVRYDSSNEPLSVTQRRLKALRVLGILALLAAAWLGFRFLTVNG